MAEIAILYFCNFHLVSSNDEFIAQLIKPPPEISKIILVGSFELR